MKTLHINSIRAAARERPAGYEEDLLARGRVVRDVDGNPERVTFTDEVFAELVSKYSPHNVRAAVPAAGPGTELKKLLAGWPFKIVATANCSCNAKAAEMDRRGIEWCEANVDEIVGWLREEAARRSLPFFDAAGRMLVRRAIAKARKASTAA